VRRLRGRVQEDGRLIHPLGWRTVESRAPLPRRPERRRGLVEGVGPPIGRDSHPDAR
jgi:hypothetical protein